MEKINIPLTVQQIMYIAIVINEKINNNMNMRSACARTEDKQRVERLDAETKQLTEVYQAIQDSLEVPDHGQKD